MKHSEEYVTFQEYPNPNSALELIEVLKGSAIEAVLEEDSIDFDPSYTGNFQRKGYRVKLKKIDFERADQVLLHLAQASLDEVEEGYYLLDFSESELMEVIEKKDEWNRYDFLLAQKLLQQRGIVVEENKLKAFEQERIKTLSEGLKAHSAYITIGFLFSLLGGFIGILMGWYLWTHKKTLPNGDRVFTFQRDDRSLGQGMFWTGLIVLVFAVIGFTF